MKRSEWKREARKAMIRKDLTIVGLAKEFGVSRMWIYIVLDGHTTNGVRAEWDKKIGKRLGIPCEVTEEDIV